MTLEIFSSKGRIGSTDTWATEQVLDHKIIVSPRVRLSHASALGMMEHGESLLSTFSGGAVLLEGTELPVSTIAGTFTLPTNGEPEIVDWVAVVSGDDPVKLSTFLSRGMRLLSALNAYS